jgi:hypothetical protein
VLSPAAAGLCIQGGYCQCAGLYASASHLWCARPALIIPSPKAAKACGSPTPHARGRTLTPSQMTVAAKARMAHSRASIEVATAPARACQARRGQKSDNYGSKTSFASDEGVWWSCGAVSSPCSPPAYGWCAAPIIVYCHVRTPHDSMLQTKDSVSSGDDRTGAARTAAKAAPTTAPRMMAAMTRPLMAFTCRRRVVWSCDHPYG